MSFDGINDYIDLGTNINNYLNNHFSITAWVNMNQNSIENNIISNSYPGVPSGFELRVAGGDIFFTYKDNNGSQYSTYRFGLNINQWYFVGVVCDGNSINLYVDSVEYSGAYNYPSHTIDPSYSFGGISPPSNSLKFGANTWGHFVNGYLDDVSIWNTDLTQQEIQSYMNCPPTGNELDLVGYWNFEEGTGTTVYDQTSNGNYGTINGATYVPSSFLISSVCILIYLIL